jgi:hypothetical protein
MLGTAVQRALPLFAVFMLFASPALRAAGVGPVALESELFRVERSKNRNVVRYVARVVGDRELDARAPVDAYWLLLAEDGRHEALSWLERQFAYGFSLTRAGGQLRLSLVALRERSLSLHLIRGHWCAVAAIAGKPAVLKRIWVQTDEGLFGPHVRWVDLHGSALGSGTAINERVLPPSQPQYGKR